MQNRVLYLTALVAFVACCSAIAVEQEQNDISAPVPEARSLSSSLQPPADLKNIIDSRYNKNTLPSLASYIYSFYRPNDQLSFANMVKAQLYLFNKFMDNGDVNDKYLFDLAYFASQITSDGYFGSLSSKLQRRFKEDMTLLPPSVQMLFSTQKFCLINRAYSEFIYTSESNNIDNKSRYVFTWGIKETVGSKGALLSGVSNSAGNGQNPNLSFTLKSSDINMYLYMARNLNYMVAAWRSGKKPANSAWSAQLVQNQLVFSQNGRLMCASNDLYSNHRRYVFGTQSSATDAACQWYALQCP